MSATMATNPARGGGDLGKRVIKAVEMIRDIINRIPERASRPPVPPPSGHFRTSPEAVAAWEASQIWYHKLTPLQWALVALGVAAATGGIYLAWKGYVRSKRSQASSDEQADFNAIEEELDKYLLGEKESDFYVGTAKPSVSVELLVARGRPGVEWLFRPSDEIAAIIAIVEERSGEPLTPLAQIIRQRFTG